MPLFYFDFHDGERMQIDDTGVACASVAEARAQAVRVLPAVACDAQPDRDYRDFEVRVRDEGQRCVLRASIALEVEWLTEEALPKTANCRK